MAKTTSKTRATEPKPMPSHAPATPAPQQPQQVQTVSPTPPRPAPMMPIDSGVSTIMQNSLPPIASGSDVYTRQFYGGAPLPKRRFLPVGLVP
jgi:hypothetical protein